MENKVLLSRQSLARRWDYKSPDVIAKYEEQGIIQRVKDLPYPRYNINEIIKIENSGTMNPLSPVERIRLEKKISDLEAELANYRIAFTKTKSLISELV